jgi:hemerythrin-like domain-containing protein
MDNDRRRFLARSAALGATGLSGGAALAYPPPDSAKKDEEEVSAAEDLMREHGVLNRVLLIYEEGLRRLAAKEDIPPDVFRTTATLVRKFVEDYHERLEETFIFPAFEKKNQLTDLVKVLRSQHDAGRKVTDVILHLAEPDRFRNGNNRRELVDNIHAFIRMYRPHEAREDTVLFPALHKVFTTKELDALGDKFEKEEDRLFGEEGFEKTVEQVAGIEKQLGIYELSQFTPKLPVK